MVEKLSKLYNTLLLIETKGENTKIMGQCITYLEQLIVEQKQADAERNEAKVSVDE